MIWPFKHKTLKAVVAEELHEARLDQLAAERAAEHYLALAEMLKVRISRLEGQVK